MRVLKLYGFTVDEQEALRRIVHPVRCEVGQLETLEAACSPETVWVVSVAVCEAAGRVLRRSRLATPQGQGVARLPQALLWVPQGQAPLPFKRWGSAFYRQLCAEDEEDRTVLQRLSRCASVLEWSERIANIPAAWFAALTGSPRLSRVDDLPFSEAEKEHLHRCPDCREEVYMQLHQEAALHWALLCPSVEELTTWIEAQEDDPDIEAHVARCGLCRETVQLQGRLWAGEGLLTATQVNAKLTAVGIAEPVAAAWLVAAFAWQQRQLQNACMRGVFLAAVLGQVVRPARAAWRSAGTSAGATPEMQEALEADLTAGKPVTLSDKEHWLHVMVEGDTVLLRAGRSPADLFPQLRLEFRRGDEVLLAVEAEYDPQTEGGVVRLTPGHFQRVQQEHANQLCIIV